MHPPTEPELEILKVLWTAGYAMRVPEIHGKLQKEQAISTTATVLNRMAVKGLVVKTALGDGGRSVAFAAAKPAEEVRESVFRRVLGFFSGSASSLVAGLLEDGHLHPDDLKHLEAKFAEAEADRKKKTGRRK